MKKKSRKREKDIEWNKIIPLAAVILGMGLFAVVFTLVTYRVVVAINVGGFMAYVITDGGKYGMLFFILLSSVLVGMGISIATNHEKRARENSHLW